MKCGRCQREIPLNTQHRFKEEIVCGDCLMDLRADRGRKTHWQYVRSIRTEYLIRPRTQPAKEP